MAERKGLKGAALVVAILFALGVVCTATGTLFFGSSKIRPLFGMSAEALAGPPAGKDARLKKKVDFFSDAGAY